MTVALAEFNALPEDQAAELLRACCGSSRWVERMIAGRPFSSVDKFVTAADDIWRALDASDWLEAFAHHPRIGERRSSAPQSERAASWSAGEQASVTTAAARVTSDLAAINAEYERRFGFIYIVCASGRSADNLLATARMRLHNDAATELEVAAEEQRKITTLRLGKLITELS